MPWQRLQFSLRAPNVDELFGCHVGCDCAGLGDLDQGIAGPHFQLERAAQAFLDREQLEMFVVSLEYGRQTAPLAISWIERG